MYRLIYIIKNSINNKVYIGQTNKTLKKRLYQHQHDSSGCIKLLHAIKKHKLENFNISLLLVTHTKEISDYWERYFVKKYDSVKMGYNIRDGGSHGVLPPASRLKISEASRKQTNRKGWEKGKPRSEETKLKIGEGNKGKIISPETRRKISEAKVGKRIGIGNPGVKGRSWKMINGKRVYEPRNKVSQ